MGQLYVSFHTQLFKQAMATASADLAQDWSEQLEKANLFVKCIQQRNNTMRRLMQLLVSQQEKFILEGARHLIPMTRAEIAEQIGVHESTISRAVRNACSSGAISEASSSPPA